MKVKPSKTQSYAIPGKPWEPQIKCVKGVEILIPRSIYDTFESLDPDAELIDDEEIEEQSPTEALNSTSNYVDPNALVTPEDKDSETVVETGEDLVKDETITGDEDKPVETPENEEKETEKVIKKSKFLKSK